MYWGNRQVARISRAIVANRPVSLLILEGDTEAVFYSIIRDTFLAGLRIELRNMKGQGNVNKDVLGEIYKYAYNNSTDLVRAYCCVDTERQNKSATPLDLNLVRQHIRENTQLAKVLSVDAILADPDIESWFFYDIEGIYKFLKAKKSLRTLGKYANPKSLCKQDLQALFRRFKKAYIPGKRAEPFIRSLDIAKIVSACKELSDGIERIKSQANDSTNSQVQ